MALASFNLMQWIEDNRAQLTPPMVNKPIWRDRDFLVMILAGPILRAYYDDIANGSCPDCGAPNPKDPNG